MGPIRVLMTTLEWFCGRVAPSSIHSLSSPYTHLPSLASQGHQHHAPEADGQKNSNAKDTV
ncbi:hypothetical protein E2C01_047987 [Portunus trituberculatus]|uniref:Uncharacterized protein n=1 Tax=Portunus trituberculatus TaxID=210409 RepID=A0A5B7G1Y7_PORTR|nr:hypothetical protein [Portunus trituberculatus]